MHQAMLLTAQVHHFSLVSAHKLTCYFRACIGARYCQFIWLALLATRNWVRWLVFQAGILLQSFGVVIPWWPGILSIYWGCSIGYFATADGARLPQGSSSRWDAFRDLWFGLLFGFGYSGNCESIIPYHIRVYSRRQIRWSSTCRILFSAFQIWLPAMN